MIYKEYNEYSAINWGMEHSHIIIHYAIYKNKSEIFIKTVIPQNYIYRIIANNTYYTILSSLTIF